MMTLEAIGVALTSEAATAAGKAAIMKLRPTEHPRITNARFLNVLPRRVGLPISLDSEDAAQATFGGLRSIAFGNDIWKCQWIDCAEFFFRIENDSMRDSISIKGFHIETNPTTDHPQASLLEESQGVAISGDCHRFLTVLDAHTPIMQKYAIMNHVVEFTDDQDYFDCSSIEIPPNAGINIALTLVVEATSRRITDISIIYGSIGNNELERQSVKMESDIRIYPLSTVPENQRFRTMYSNNDRSLSSVTTEADESAIPRSAQTYRWSEYHGRN